MTPKEKAKELFDAYKENVYQFHDEVKKHLVKKCSFIAVDEAEKSEYNVLIKFGFVTENYTSDYWQQVKEEIEKL